MDVRGYLRVFRRQWLVIVLCVLIGAGAAALVTFRTTPQYASTVRLFVSTPGTDATNAANAQAYQGGLFSQQRVTSYADLIKGSSVAGRVIDKLKLNMSPTTLVDQISAVATPESVILEITVTDPSPMLAQTARADHGRGLRRLRLGTGGREQRGRIAHQGEHRGRCQPPVEPGLPEAGH